MHTLQIEFPTSGFRQSVQSKCRKNELLECKSSSINNKRRSWYKRNVKYISECRNGQMTTRAAPLFANIECDVRQSAGSGILLTTWCNSPFMIQWSKSVCVKKQNVIQRDNTFCWEYAFIRCALRKNPHELRTNWFPLHFPPPDKFHLIDWNTYH